MALKITVGTTREQVMKSGSETQKLTFGIFDGNGNNRVDSDELDMFNSDVFKKGNSLSIHNKKFNQTVIIECTNPEELKTIKYEDYGSDGAWLDYDNARATMYHCREKGHVQSKGGVIKVFPQNEERIGAIHVENSKITSAGVINASLFINNQ